MCIYGMDSPGGYQLVGRTLPIWNNYTKKNIPWLLRNFDQIRFYPTSDDELDMLREDFRHGKLEIKMESTMFDVQAYKNFLHNQSADICEFKAKQSEAFNKEVTS